MSLVGLAIHIGLLTLAVAILCPAALTLLALLIYEAIRDPQKPPRYLPQGGTRQPMKHEPQPPEFWTDCLPCRTGYYELCTETHEPSDRTAFFMPERKS